MVDYNRNRETSRAESQGCPVSKALVSVTKLWTPLQYHRNSHQFPGLGERRIEDCRWVGCPDADCINLWLVAEWTQHGLSRREKIEGWGHVCHGKKYRPDSTSYARVREAPGPLGAQPALASTAYGDERGNQVAPETSNPRYRDQPPRPTLTRLPSMSTSSRSQNVRGLLTHAWSGT